MQLKEQSLLKEPTFQKYWQTSKDVDLLDLSAAFDTVDYTILLHHLFVSHPIAGRVLDWFASCHRDRTKCHRHRGVTGPSRPLQCGISQGSVLDPVMFLLHASDILSF